MTNNTSAGKRLTCLVVDGQHVGLSVTGGSTACVEKYTYFW